MEPGSRGIEAESLLRRFVPNSSGGAVKRAAGQRRSSQHALTLHVFWQAGLEVWRVSAAAAKAWRNDGRGRWRDDFGDAPSVDASGHGRGGGVLRRAQGFIAPRICTLN